jgi:hypothetical protein
MLNKVGNLNYGEKCAMEEQIWNQKKKELLP